MIAHNLENWREFRKITTKKRKLLVRSKRICFNYLFQRHMDVNCTPFGGFLQAIGQIPRILGHSTYRVRKNGKEVRTYALLNSGANKTFYERNLLESLDVTDAKPVVFDISLGVSIQGRNCHNFAYYPSLNNKDAIDLSRAMMTEAISASSNKMPDSCLCNPNLLARGQFR